MELGSPNVWLVFWPILAVGAYIGYAIASRKQGKKVPLSYTLLIFGALVVLCLGIYLVLY